MTIKTDDATLDFDTSVAASVDTYIGKAVLNFKIELPANAHAEAVNYLIDALVSTRRRK